MRDLQSLDELREMNEESLAFHLVLEMIAFRPSSSWSSGVLLAGILVERVAVVSSS